MITPKDIYAQMNRALLPMQGVVSIMLVVIIAVSVYMLFSRNAVLRTAWAVYMWSP